MKRFLISLISLLLLACLLCACSHAGTTPDGREKTTGVKTSQNGQPTTGTRDPQTTDASSLPPDSSSGPLTPAEPTDTTTPDPTDTTAMPTVKPTTTPDPTDTTATPTVTPTTTPENEGLTLGGVPVKVGGVVKFGSCEQDGDPENGKEAIEWLVLAIQGNRALLLSKNVLDAKPCHTYDRDLTWEESPLRAYLNEEFCREAFDGEELPLIAVTKVHTDDESADDLTVGARVVVPGGNDVYDRVFLLSRKEASEFLFDENQLPEAGKAACAPSAYAASRGASADETGCAAWWLRSPGIGHAKILQLCVTASGVIGGENCGELLGVRPALFVELTEETEIEAIPAKDYAQICRDYIEGTLYELTVSQTALDGFLADCTEPQGVMGRACDAVPGGEVDYFMENGAFMSVDQFWRYADCMRPGFSTLKLSLTKYACAPLPAVLACGPFSPLSDDPCAFSFGSCRMRVFFEENTLICSYEGSRNGEAYRAEIRRTVSAGHVWNVEIETRIDHKMPEERDHTFGLWRTVKPQTCTTDGRRDRKCEVCGYVDSEVLPAPGHEYAEKVCVFCGSEKEGLTEEREDGFYTVLRRIENRHGAYIPLFRLLNFAGVKIEMIDTSNVCFEMKRFGRLTLNTRSLSIRDENGEDPIPPSPGNLDFVLFCKDNGHIYVEFSCLLVQELFETHPELSETLREDGKLELKKSKPEPRQTPEEYTPFLPGEKVVAFTFDDGPDMWTGEILDALEDGDKLTFFITGYMLDRSERYDVPYVEYVKRAEKMGCEIGIHCYYHEDNVYITSQKKDASSEVYEREITKLDKKYREIFGRAPQLWRPMGGNFNPKRDYGYTAVLWSVDSYDWRTFYENRASLLSNDEEIKEKATEQAVNEIAERILSQVRAGDIVLMHDIYYTTCLAFKKVYKTLKDEGWRFVTVSELLQIDPSAHHGQYFYSTDYFGYNGKTYKVK